MPTFTSPEAGDITAPDGWTASKWLMHRLAHARYGERAIAREFQAWPLDPDATVWSAAAYIGAPRPGDGRLDYTGLTVYDVDAQLLIASYL